MGNPSLWAHAIGGTLRTGLTGTAVKGYLRESTEEVGCMNKRDEMKIPSLRELRDFDQAFNGAFSLVAFVVNRHMIDHILRAARLLDDGDFESLILWGILAHQNVAHLMPPGSMPAAVLTETGNVPDVEVRLRPLLLRDLSQISGIPRETARRKLERLVQQKFVGRVGRGWVGSTDRLESDLREHTRETVKRLLAVADEVRAALAAVERASTRSSTGLDAAGSRG